MSPAPQPPAPQPDRSIQNAFPWLRSKVFWTFIVGEIGVLQLAWEAYKRGADTGTVFFGALAGTAVLVQNVFLRQTQVQSTAQAVTVLKAEVQDSQPDPRRGPDNC